MSTQVVAYCRVSSKEQERGGFSIPAQQKLLKEYALKNNFIMAKEFCDAETAKRAGRTNFNEMLKFFKANPHIKTLLVEKTDRLYRNFRDYITLEEYDLEVHLVKENTVISKDSRSHDKFIHGIKVLMAKNYIDNLSEEVKKGQKESAEEGYYPAKLPYGYYRAANKQIIINEKEAQFVKAAFSMYSVGNISLRHLTQKLKNNGYIFKPETPEIPKTTLELMLKRFFYTGFYKYKGLVYEGRYSAIVSQEEFKKAQIAFGKDNKPKFRNSHQFAFAGLLTCGECGCTITADIKKGKYIYYKCTNHRPCSQNVYISEEQIEKQLKYALIGIGITKQHLEKLKIALKGSFMDENKYNQEQVQQISEKIEKLETRLRQLYVDKLDGNVDNEMWLEYRNKWNVEIFSLKEQLEALKVADMKYMDKGCELLEIAHKAYILAQNGDYKNNSEILFKVLNHPTLKDGKLSYEYTKPFNLFAEGLKCTVDLGRKDSNLRMPGPKPGALPLGDAPIFDVHLSYKRSTPVVKSIFSDF